MKDFYFVNFGIRDSRYARSINLEYDRGVTGIGDNLIEAIDDCLEQMFNTEDIKERIMRQECWDTIPCHPDVRDMRCDTEHLSYYVEIYWNE